MVCTQILDNVCAQKLGKESNKTIGDSSCLEILVNVYSAILKRDHYLYVESC